jgi:hypothetical protein
VRVHDLSVPGNLSRVSWKLSRTVLRGGTNSNVGPLLDERHGASKQPFCFEVKDGELFVFAGLWDGWKDSSGQWMKTCSILTTTPNAVTATVHDRMPVILDPDSYDLWLDPGMTNVRGSSPNCSSLTMPCRCGATPWTRGSTTRQMMTLSARDLWSLQRLRIGSSSDKRAEIMDAVPCGKMLQHGRLS